MNEKEMIEDLASIIDSFNIRTYRNAQAVAKFLIEKYNYRKINENEVVISKEEKQKLLKEMYEQGKFDALADLEKDGKVVLDRQEHQKYCAYKIIEPQIRGCLDRERELESENESCYEVLADLKAIIKQQNDRIAELEKENVELKVDLKNSLDMQKQMLDGFKTAIKEVEENIAREIPNLLKQFAERVKMEFYYEFDEIIPSIMSDKIDKILKEILGE